MKLIVEVSYDQRLGYVARHPQLRASITALSLALLRRRVEEQLRLSEPEGVQLALDKRARQERDQRRKGGHGGAEQWNRTR